MELPITACSSSYMKLTLTNVCRRKLKPTKAETRVIIPSDYRRQHYKCIFYAWCINLLGTEPRIYLSRMNVTNGTRAYLQEA